jgi:hypothetical protein
MPYTANGTYISPWMLRSQENSNKPAPLSFNKPVVKQANNNGRVAFPPVRVVPKLRKTRKNRKSRKAGTRRR